jgi:hypothetical protein
MRKHIQDMVNKSLGRRAPRAWMIRWQRNLFPTDD